jgi:hypothetical protein
MMSPDQEKMLRMFVRRMSDYLAGQPLDLGVSPIKPSQVRGIEAKLTATGVRESFAGQHGEMSNFLRGASTVENYAKAAKGFDIQNDVLQAFCRLLTQKTGERCGIIMGPSKKEMSTLKKYWAGGSETSGWQGQFKDLCRCTLVCYNEDEYTLLPSLIREELANACYRGKWMIVPDERAKPGDTGKVRRRNDANPDDLGYTDTNISLMLPNGARIEVQVNIQSTLYGKMGRPAFMEEACPPGLGQDQYVAMERKKRLPGGCGHVLYEVYKEFHAGKQCNMTIDQVRQLSRNYYDHLSGYQNNLKPDEIVQGLTELSKSEIWIATYKHTQKDNPRNLPAFLPGTKWRIGDRV